jgi:NitT/TauT family transport system substrate-binding protein
MRNALVPALVCGLLLASACAPAAAPAPATQAPAPPAQAAAPPTQAPAPATPPTQSPTRLTKLNVVLSAASGNFAGLYTAAEAGYFREEGLDVEFVTTDSSARSLPMLVSGEAQFSTVDAQTLIQADLKGADLRMIAAGVNRLVFSIMVDPSIKTPEDMRGKRLGVTTLGSSTHTSAIQALNMWKLEDGKDVTIIPLNSVPNILVGLQTKQVEAGVLSPPTNTRAKLAGFAELLNLAKDGPEFPSITIAATQTFLSKNPQVATAFVRAYSRALHRFKTDRAMAVQAMGHYLQLDDRAVLEDTWQQYLTIFDDVPYVTEPGLRNIIEFLSQSMPEAVGATPDRFLDTSFVRQLEEAGFYKTLLNGA